MLHVALFAAVASVRIWAAVRVSPMRQLGLSLLLLLIVLGVIEALSWGASEYLTTKGVFYEPQVVKDYARYERERDPILGWPALADDQRDESGSRIVPAFPDTRVSCLSIYGDSWTWGGNDHEHTWGNVLSQLLGCRVANYGVGGYGSDQAYLRLLQIENDRSPVVFLGHLSENILRNVNQLRGILYAGTPYGLKPRFILDERGELVLVPLLKPSEEEFRDLVVHPEKYLAHEFLLPGGLSGTAIRRFPYTLSVLGAFRHFHVIAELRREPWHTAFYAPDHPSRGLEITARIMEAFHREAVRRGRTPILAVIPTGLDLEYFGKHRRWVYESLIERLHALGLEVLDLGPGMVKADRRPQHVQRLRVRRLRPPPERGGVGDHRARREGLPRREATRTGGCSCRDAIADASLTLGSDQLADRLASATGDKHGALFLERGIVSSQTPAGAGRRAP